MFWRHFWFTLIWALIILILYGIPGSDMPKLTMWRILAPDKIAHAGVFAILTPSLCLSFFKQAKYLSFRRNATRNGVIISSAYGIILELLQGSFFLERTTDVMDILANLIGVLIGVVILRLIFKKIIS